MVGIRSAGQATAALTSGNVAREVVAPKQPGRAAPSSPAGPTRPTTLDSFEASTPAATERMRATLSPAPLLPGDTDVRPDPALPPAQSAATYKPVANGRLFVDGAAPEDVIQGGLGDCFLLSAMSAVASADSDLLAKAIKDNGNGTYQVRLFAKQADGPVAPKTFRIDGDLPSAGGELLFGKARQRNETWVPLLEKAYASTKAGYASISHGGKPGEALTALTGRPTTSTRVLLTGKYKTLELMKSAQERHAAMTANTYPSAKCLAGLGLLTNHSYAVLGTEEEGGVSYVKLRNPWGFGEFGNDGKNDGVFRMNLDDFYRSFIELHVS
ncbi:MAG: hypothetical protein HY901_31115 [Deltaproteobacteria bacterium]|nr:hypothetical protein [Deltaproteobacteria bacterium]